MNKVTYTDQTTRINAQNLNNIQDAINTLETKTEKYGSMANTDWQTVANMDVGGANNIYAVEILAHNAGPNTYYPANAISGDGYCQMADGTLIQWGSGDFGTVSANDSTYTLVNFPKAFKDVNSYTLIAYGAYHYQHVLEVVGTKYSASTCRIYGNNRTANAITQYALYSWVAIGRWRA